MPQSMHKMVNNLSLLYAVNGDGSLGTVGGKHHFALVLLQWLKHFLLFICRKLAMQWKHLKKEIKMLL
jgi:hypothetical protein